VYHGRDMRCWTVLECWWDSDGLGTESDQDAVSALGTCCCSSIMITLLQQQHHLAAAARNQMRHLITWAAHSSTGSWRESIKGLTRASCRQDLVGPGRLTCYAIGSTTSADPRGFSTGPSLGRLLEQGHPPLDPQGYATLRGRGLEQRLGALEDSEADGCWRTKRSNGHVMLS
jgi:hypothetical protein